MYITLPKNSARNTNEAVNNHDQGGFRQKFVGKSTCYAVSRTNRTTDKALLPSVQSSSTVTEGKHNPCTRQKVYASASALQASKRLLVDLFAGGWYPQRVDVN